MRTRKAAQRDSLIYWYKYSSTYQIGEDAKGVKYSADKYQGRWHLAVTSGANIVPWRLEFDQDTFDKLEELKQRAERIAAELTTLQR